MGAVCNIAHLSSLSYIIVLGSLPPAPLLGHVPTITPTTLSSGSHNAILPIPTSVMTTNATITDTQAAAHRAISIGQGLPPVPKKLVNKIESGEYLDMAELLPDRLGSYRSLTLEDKGGVPKSKRRAVTNILEWIQCFSIYIAIIALKHPDRVPDLLGYQSLIIDASIQYEGDSWIGYDRRFRLSAAANSTRIWASLDPTLWNLAFAGNARVSRCKHCFSLTHPSIECEWASEAAQPISTPPRPLMDPTRQYRRICRKWNNTPGRCPVPGCTYEHICLTCAYDSTISNKVHKVIHCPNRKSLGGYSF